MKIGYVGAVPLNLMFGGGETQMINTFNVVKKYGIDVSYYDFYNKDEQFDIVHIFGCHYWHYNLIYLLKSKGIPVVLSPISYSPGRLFQYKIWDFFDRLLPVKTTYKLHKEIINLVDVLLPNSKTEAEYLKNHFGANNDKIEVVYNGINNPNSNSKKSIFFEKYGFEEFVLCVGKIEPRKNQIELVKALKKLNRKCVFVGAGMLNNIEYFNDFKKLIFEDDRFLHIEYIEHNSDLMASLYMNAKIHVLLGKNETPGLVNLEAASYGCDLIVWDCPPVREYLKDYAFYIDKNNLKYLHNIIEDKFLSNKRVTDVDFIIQNYSWDRIGVQNIELYNRLFRCL
jgi:glycosyltransferase involved in cell wall biosynthesis